MDVELMEVVEAGAVVTLVEPRTLRPYVLQLRYGAFDAYLRWRRLCLAPAWAASLNPGCWDTCVARGSKGGMC